jgi:hypothetical protein
MQWSNKWANLHDRDFNDSFIFCKNEKETTFDYKTFSKALNDCPYKLEHVLKSS